MKQFIFLVKFYLTFLLLFVLAKPCFVLVQSEEIRGNITFTSVLSAMYHGISLDIATAAYISAVIWLLGGIELWIRIWRVKAFYKAYTAIAAFTFSLIVFADCCLYGFWRLKIDGTVFNYLDSPQDIFESVSIPYLLTAAGCIVLLTYGVYRLLILLMPDDHEPTKHRIFWSVIWLFLGSFLFLGIRGGVDKSCTNVGQVYFSENQFLNHTAVNPCFSILASIPEIQSFDEEFNFFEESERKKIFESLGYNTQSVNTKKLLTVERPNVLIVLMEGCGGTFVHAVDPKSDPYITPNLNRLAADGIVFTQCYANSFRTDRGMVCSYSGYPSFPNLSVMKVTSLCQKLPSIANSLRKAGYQTSFMYSGDINFTNTKGYLISTGYEKTLSQEDFPEKVRHTHDWGVTDRIMFDTLYNHIMRQPKDKPWHVGVMTLASHEPWKVPYNRIPNDPIANAMAFLDVSLGNFINRLRKTEVWENTLVIFMPDHGIEYPADISPLDERKSHIPLIWTGGVVPCHRRINTICNQSDLAATLLGQLGLPHDDFYFSRDVLSSTYTHPSAVHTWSEGIYYKDSTGISVLNLKQEPAGIFRESPSPSPQRVKAAKAILQTIYDHL